ncbi:SNARE associated Golgi protein [Candidatus Vecturithrix granuli]|uniref:TVP38/TMEM64 family membrane protein n=1 Tax=Vecturithrix granuli TaxID=1499967 RepID=A0A081CAF3_VECG1|nr:SNARE associated Golgi protein [Candidatus Vecturithrix granuli]
MTEENYTLKELSVKKRPLVQKILVIGAILLLVILFYAFDLGQYFSLEYVKASQARFALAYQAQPALVIATYMGIYILMAALSLPGAAVMTLLGGALFGRLIGTVAVSFASTIGATLAYLVSRFLLRDWVQSKVGKRLQPINEGVEREGAFYLFTMRLIPAFPFWLINLAMGLTKMPLWSFYWVSQIGMLPGTFVYVNAGTELARIDSLKGILNPTLIISFVILGLFPLIVKKLLSLYKRPEQHRHNFDDSTG